MSTGHRSRGQRGELLVETLLSLFFLTTVLVAVVGLLFTTILSSSTQRGVVGATNEATTVAEQIDRAVYLPCGTGTPVDYSAALGIAAAGYTSYIDLVEYQNSTAGSSSYGTSCPAGGDQGTQRITVRVAADEAPNPEGTITLVKRDQTCPGGLGTQVMAGQPC